MRRLIKAILVSSLALVMFEAMAGGPSARKDVQAAKTLNTTNAADIVRRWCRSPAAFVKYEELSIPMQCGPIPDDVQSACRILALKNPDVLLAAYSVEFFFYAIADGVCRLFARHGRWNGLDGPDEEPEDPCQMELALQ